MPKDENGFHPDPRPTEELIHETLWYYLSGKDYRVLVELLQYRGNDEVLDVASELITSDDPYHRILGADILGGLGLPAIAYVEESASMLIPLLEDSDMSVVISAAEGISKRSPHLKESSATKAFEKLMPLKQNPDHEVRNVVASALSGIQSQIHNPEVLDRLYSALVELSEDAARTVRRKAVYGLSISKTNVNSVMDALRISTSDRDDKVRACALLGLAKKHYPNVSELLVKEFSSNSKYIYDESLNAAVIVADSCLLPILSQLKESGIENRFLDEAIKACSAV